MSDRRIEIDNGNPYLVGEHFTLGDRHDVDPAEHGIVLPPVPEGIRERWSSEPAPRWEITIGEAGGKP
ncbi:hypothetical protein [Nocardia sp. NPDC003963]